MYQDPSLAKVGRHPTAKCSSSMQGLVDSLRLPKFSMKSTSLTTSHSHLSFLRTYHWTLVRRRNIIIDCFLMILDAYDVNVSPDKRTILLHDQTNLLESIRVRSRSRVLGMVS